MKRGVAEGEGGESEGAVGGAEEGFGARFDESGEGDGEFADTEPAGAAVEIRGEWHVGDGLDGEAIW